MPTCGSDCDEPRGAREGGARRPASGGRSGGIIQSMIPDPVVELADGPGVHADRDPAKRAPPRTCLRRWRRGRRRPADGDDARPHRRARACPATWWRTADRASASPRQPRGVPAQGDVHLIPAYDAAERARQEAYRAVLLASALEAGYPEAIARPMTQGFAYTPGVAITFRAEEVFRQTPGPGAGPFCPEERAPWASSRTRSSRPCRA